MSSMISPLMRWHDEGRTKNGLLRYPVVLWALKQFDSLYSKFSFNHYDVYLALAFDGFNPFRTMNIVIHNTWLVILNIYNLPL